MSRIAFFLEHEEGHLLPTFPLAKRLMARGHEVSYIGLADAADLVMRQGFSFFPILQDVFPPGSARTQRDMIEGPEPAGGGQAVGYLAAAEHADIYMGSLVRGKDLQEAVDTIRPDLFLISTHQPLNALALRYRFRLPVVLFTPWLRHFSKPEYGRFIENSMLRLHGSGMEFLRLVQKADPAARRLAEITTRFTELRELILCPSEVDLPRPEWQEENEVFYIESSVDLSRGRQDEFCWDRVLPGRKVLYCSLGSQSQNYGYEKLRLFLNAVAAAAAELPEWQLVLATGLVAPEEITGLPADAIVQRWVPQIPILERTSLMITHAGLGTIKECIFNRVPMLAYPLFSDQPENARRIVHHGLGLASECDGATPSQIAGLVRQIEQDPAVLQNLARMRQRFLEIEESGIGVQRIEEVLEQQRAAS